MGKINESYQEAKAWYKSKTIIGILIALAGTILKTWYPEIDLQSGVDQALTEGDKITEGLDSIYGSVMEIFGFILAAYGRVKAKLGIKPLL